MEIPIKPIKNEDGTYTVKFPNNIIVEDEDVATYLQMIITEFAFRLYTDEQILYKEKPRHLKREKGV